MGKRWISRVRPSWHWLGKAEDIRGRLYFLVWAGGIVVAIAAILTNMFGPWLSIALVIGLAGMVIGSVGLLQERRHRRGSDPLSPAARSSAAMYAEMRKQMDERAKAEAREAVWGDSPPEQSPSPLEEGLDRAIKSYKAVLGVRSSEFKATVDDLDYQNKRLTIRRHDGGQLGFVRAVVTDPNGNEWRSPFHDGDVVSSDYPRAFGDANLSAPSAGQYSVRWEQGRPGGAEPLTGEEEASFSVPPLRVQMLPEHYETHGDVSPDVRIEGNALWLDLNTFRGIAPRDVTCIINQPDGSPAVAEKEGVGEGNDSFEFPREFTDGFVAKGRYEVRWFTVQPMDDLATMVFEIE